MRCSFPIILIFLYDYKPQPLVFDFCYIYFKLKHIFWAHMYNLWLFSKPEETGNMDVKVICPLYIHICIA